MRKSIAIFGSTGSIGKQTVELIEQDLSQYNIEVITANNNFALLAQQAKRLNAKKVVVVNEQYYQRLKQALYGFNIEVLSGENALVECAKIAVDTSVIAIVGITALSPTIQALKHARIVAIANKESLVCAGNIINNISNLAKIIPIDSEHNAIFQVYNEQVDGITLTASGGPFYRNKTNNITIQQAVKHPIWSMGRKISVDSATMMNKVLEVIEAHYLFTCDINKIDIIIHPEAIIHGMVSYIDGNNIAVLSNPDMKIPIAYALNWPNRKTIPCKLDLTKIRSLSFYKPNCMQFPALKFIQVDNYVALNAANEIAVNLFLDGKINFDDIVPTIDNIISSCPDYTPNSIEEILEYDKSIKALTKEKILCKG